ncbi:MAG: iron ABC transporter permease [Alphaproteobacteria bacterium]|nr:iron ABC transporter permease [Alphaproteobacteria bacterium]
MTETALPTPAITKPAPLYPLVILLVMALLVLAAFSLALGKVEVPLLAAAKGMLADGPPLISILLAEIRLPRTLLTILVGGSLGLAGAALQGLLRKPLAAPGLIGISSSAALGSVLVFYFGFAEAFFLALPMGGIAGALLVVLLIYGIAGRDASILTLILAGVAISSFASALTSLALNLAPSPYAAYEIVFWILGSVADRSFNHVAFVAPLMAIGWVLLLRTGRALDALSLGEETAATLGFHLPRVRFAVIVGTALAVGAAVSVTGVIAFVGLVVPHLLRPLVGHQPSRLLGVSALGGAILLLAGDIAVRVFSPGLELKLGVLTAMIGAPFFLYLILKTRREMR